MPKFGRGLGREIVSAVNNGLIEEPFNVASVRALALSRIWKCSENYLAVCLANAATTDHSFNFKKYFESLGNGLYRVKIQFKGPEWV